jgi:outer membrane protein assembly factor BamB
MVSDSTRGDRTATSADQDADVRGRIAVLGGSIVVTTAERPASGWALNRQVTGIAAYGRDTLARTWRRRGMPGLSAVAGGTIYAYSRGGVVVALDFMGGEIWRSAVPDDRSEPARRRGEAGAPFQADVAEMAGALYVPAGGEILRLSPKTGAVLNRTRVCAPPRGVVARLTASPDAMYATCTERSSWDDEASPADPIWEGSPTPPARRVAGGALVALSLDLNERFRFGLEERDLAPGDRPPVVLEDGRVALAAAKLRRERGSMYLDSFEAALLVVDDRTGQLSWLRTTDGSHDEEAPCLVANGLLAGATLSLYDLVNGEPRWRLSRGEHDIDAATNVVLSDAGPLVAASKGIYLVDVTNGQVSRAGDFGLPERALLTTPLVPWKERAFIGVEQRGRSRLMSVRIR